MAEIATLDHTGINVQFGMDQACGLFSGLGFSLTERGYHSMGSINHLMVFGPDYLELVGLPPGTENPLTNYGAMAPGINGLVFRTTDVDVTFTHLQEIDMDVAPPKSFTRPVRTAEGEAMASFRTVAVRPGIFPGGRVYFCEHGTPELVWRTEWQNHANGALATPEFVIASGANEKEAEDLAHLLHSDLIGAGNALEVPLAQGKISVLTGAAYRERYGALASPMEERSSIFGALVFRAENLDGIRSVDAPMMDEADRVVVREANFDCVLEFVL